jgi:hypothetical protein
LTQAKVAYPADGIVLLVHLNAVMNWQKALMLWFAGIPLLMVIAVLML